jgi:hypothetical protein
MLTLILFAFIAGCAGALAELIANELHAPWILPRACGLAVALLTFALLT